MSAIRTLLNLSPEEFLQSFEGLTENQVKGKLGESAAQLAFNFLNIPILCNIKYKDNGRLSDIDIIALVNDTLYHTEVKNWAETTEWSKRLFIDKVQNRFYKAFPIVDCFRRQFLKWIPNLKVELCLISSHFIKRKCDQLFIDRMVRAIDLKVITTGKQLVHPEQFNEEYVIWLEAISSFLYVHNSDLILSTDLFLSSDLLLSSTDVISSTLSICS
jgi:hypothetical protein